MDVVDLRNFLEPIVICPLRVTLASLAQLLSDATGDRLLVVNDWQRPLGVLHCNHLLNQLLTGTLHPTLPGLDSSTLPPADYNPDHVFPTPSLSAAPAAAISTVPSTTLQPSLTTTDNFEFNPDLLEPIMVLPNTTNWLEVATYLQRHQADPQQTQTGTAASPATSTVTTPPCVVFITEAGQVEGVLNSRRFLQFLLLQPHLLSSPGSNLSPEPSADPPASAHEPYSNLFAPPMGMTGSPSADHRDSPRWETSELSLMGTSWDLTLWLAMAQNLEQQRQTSASLAAENANLTELNRLKDEFLACISHELKTPLTAILGLASLLKEQALGPLNDRQLHYTNLIHHNGRHLTLLLNDILDLTRIEAGQLDLHHSLVDVQWICQHAFENAVQLRLAEQPPSHQHSTPLPSHPSSPDDPLAEDTEPLPFQLNIDPGLEWITADELRLRQMLVNLLSNALKSTKSVADVSLQVSLWDDHWVAFTIWDKGMGIPPDKQHLIFQKLQQLENPLTRQFEGIGLGLALTQRLAQLHGGVVTFRSVLGQGSQFTLLLPLHSNLDNSNAFQPVEGTRANASPLYTTELAAATLPPSISVNRDLSRRIILLAQEHPLVVEELSNQLTELGYWVVIGRTGRDVMEKARLIQPGLILLSASLSAIAQTPVFNLLRTKRDTRHIPILLTVKEPEQLALLNLPDAEIIRVPIPTTQLAQTLGKLSAELAPLDTNLVANLTILHLVWNGCHDNPLALAELRNLLHRQHHRLVEADDLEQADLLARIWKPDLILLTGSDGGISPLQYLQDLSTYDYLSALPLVTLNRTITAAANQVPALSVFPCLIADDPPDLTEHHLGNYANALALLKVLQVAMASRPGINKPA